MTILLWILAGIVGIVILVIALFVTLWIRSIRVSLRRDKELSAKTASVISAIDTNLPIDMDNLRLLAADPLTRAHLLSELIERKQEDMFPEDYRSLEMIAESDLVRWLFHGNELGSVPDEIELVFDQSVTEGDRTGRCFLFRYRVTEPHWAASNDWMCGVAGPFWDDEPQACMGQATFSELQPYNSRTNEEHLAYLTTCANRFGWVMPNPINLG